MPPKKAATNGESSSKMIWEGPNDLKLLLLTQGRWIKSEEYPALSSAFPGTTSGAIRNRISYLRVKQRDLYDALGWELPEGGAGHSAKKKRKGSGDGEVDGTPSKKRVNKGKEMEMESSAEMGGALDEEKGTIKEEKFDDYEV